MSSIASEFARNTSSTEVPGGRWAMSACSWASRASPPAKTRSSLAAKWLKTVFSETSAATAISATVTASKPRSANRRRAEVTIASRVARFLRSRKPWGASPGISIAL